MCDASARVGPFGLGFLSHLSTPGDPRQAYRDTLDLVVLAEDLGFDAFWIAQHHFAQDIGCLPSPFPFLAAAAERTRRIRLGTAVIALSFEHPLRVAEDASVLDHLSGGRLELGLGSASEPEAFAAFATSQASSRDDATHKIGVVKQALEARALTPAGTTLQPPPPPGLVGRLWRGVSSIETAELAAELGLGILVPRLALGRTTPTEELQMTMFDAYRARLAQVQPGVAPRLGVSRTVYPAADKATARSEMRVGVLRTVKAMLRSGRLPAELTEDEYFSRLNLFYGSPREVAEELRADRAVRQATDLLCQLDPAHVSQQQAIKALERIACEVAPALGWQPRSRA